MRAHFQCAQSPTSLEFLGFHQSWASAVPNGHKSQTAASRSQAAKIRKCLVHSPLATGCSLS